MSKPKLRNLVNEPIDDFAFDLQDTHPDTRPKIRRRAPSLFGMTDDKLQILLSIFILFLAGIAVGAASMLAVVTK